MASRPRRSAAQKASVAITDMADRDNMSSSRSRRSGDNLASVSRGSQGGKDHTYLTVKLPSSKLRQATSNKQGSSISVNNDSTPKRSTRGGKKSYVVESESDEEDDEEVGEDEIQVGAPAVVADEDEDDDEEMDDVDEDAEGEEIEEDMDIDAEGDDDEDAEGEEDVDMAPPAPAPVIKIQKANKKSPESKKTKDITPKKAGAAINDSDDDELSELESDEEMEGEEDAEGEEEDEDMDAEGEEIEEDQDAEGEPEPNAEVGQDVEEDVDSDDESAAPNKTRMTVRQRARFEELDESHYQALSNEVQAKKVFTVEEKAMRRAEMARRRRNLSEKRNEEVKQETINKLLKKQASKTNRKGGQTINEDGSGEGDWKPNPVFIRWVSTKDGERVSVPEEILEGPAGRLFVNGVRPTGAGPTALAPPRKMVEEVS
ncbi:hypothetical protein N8I77_006359 [Diaporthe amygdali]|uniref:INO80 complex subunit B-like conserved region domain-containing protein n=1 Tax=Phomopsis amygdali TaxID=1214568 RepID=A0AAD9SHM2_PHOAM|nr:hypothetical protein N8I77_006359 [Diaporthe amygdali]